MNNVMIDLETMGTKPGSLILAIGATFFDSATELVEHKEDGFYVNIDLQSGLDTGLTIDASTMWWWLGQSDAARARLLESDSVHIARVLVMLTKFLNSKGKDVKVWGNGASFDITLLEIAYLKCNLEIPWKFWNVRDCRTVEDLASKVGINKEEFERKGTHHDALENAIYQAEYIGGMYRALISK